MKRMKYETLLPNLLLCWRWINKNSAILVLGLALTTFFSAFAEVSISPESPTIEPGPILTAFNWVSDKLYESAQAMFLNWNRIATTSMYVLESRDWRRFYWSSFICQTSHSCHEVGHYEKSCPNRWKRIHFEPLGQFMKDRDERCIVLVEP